MRKIGVITSLRIGAFLCLLCITIWVISEYEFTNQVVMSFPLLSVGAWAFFPLSLFSEGVGEKGIAALVYPLCVNVLLWLPMRKAYYNIYGFVWIEKWKAFFGMVGYGISLIVLIFFFRSLILTICFWGFCISTLYYVYLRWCLKALEDEDFLSYAKVRDFRKDIDSEKVMLVL